MEICFMALRSLLRDYSAQKIGDAAIIRALVEHDAWQAPGLTAQQVLGVSTFPSIRMDGQGTAAGHPPRQVWLFTDDAALDAAIAAGARPGPVARPLTGREFMAGLTAEHFDSVLINPGLPKEEGFFFDASFFEDLGKIARGIGMEKLLSRPLDVAAREAIMAYDGFVLLIERESGKFATAPGFEGMANPVLIFTVEDCYRAVAEKLPQFRGEYFSGARLLPLLAPSADDHLLLNVLGPGPRIAVPIADLM
jgi:hypothetical protein